MKVKSNYPLRMPDDLKERVKQAAADEGRSMNAQIVQHLRAIYSDKDRTKEATG